MATNSGGSGPPGPGAAGGGAAGGPARPSRGSTLPIRGGKREVKAYALTEDELTTLGAIQGLSALFFTFAGACGGFWLSVKQQLEFAGAGVAPHTIAYWGGLQEAAKYGAILCAVIGLGLFIFNGWRVRRIKRSTVH